MSSFSGISESKVAEVLFDDPGVGEKVLAAILKSPRCHVLSSTLEDIRRDQRLTVEVLNMALAALEAAGLVLRTMEGAYTLKVSADEANAFCSFLRGMAQAKYLHRDLNHVEITLSPPMQPSRLMERLPEAGFGWARLYDTRDTLHSLASRAKKRLVILSPFVDDQGLAWVEELIQASSAENVERILIVRGNDPTFLRGFGVKRETFSAFGLKCYRYAIEHERAERGVILESFHAKIILCDTTDAYIGSSNMNKASRDVSLECGVTISGPAVRPLATLVDAIISVSERF